MSSADQTTSIAPAAPRNASGLALASRGDPLTPYLLEALARRFPIAGVIDPELSTAQRWLVALLTIRANRSRWIERFYKSTLATRLRSANADRRLRSLPRSPDVVMQVHALFRVPRSSSVVYVDCTHAQSASLWPAWNPLRGRALREWYRRERETYAAAAHLFTFSEATKSSLLNDYGLDAAKVTVTGAGVNFSQLPAPDAARRRRSQDPPVILFIGNDFVRKGGNVLLSAFRVLRETVPGARLQLVGADPGIRPQPGVEVLGPIHDRDEIAELYAGASVFVMPSLFDPYGLVVLEAMAFGLPVITTKQMGTPEMIVDGATGLLVERGDVAALADALRRVLLDPEAAERLGDAARREVEKRFTWDAVVERMAPVLDRLCARVES